jgi:hypothetical protein
VWCQVCGGLDLRVDSELHGHYQLNTQGRDGLAYDRVVERGTEVFTNLANGKSLTLVWSGLSKDLSVVDNGDGTLTVIHMWTGPTKAYGPDGSLYGTSTGQSRAEWLIDNAGTPDDPFDDVFLADLGFVKGVGTSDLVDFCADVHQLLD